MNEFLVWLSNHPEIIITLVVLIGVLIISIVLMFLIGFIQGRELIIWPPKIGALPDKQKQQKDIIRPIDSEPAKATNPIANLTGTWLCNDGATYYIRQIGSEVYWLGELPVENPKFCNVAFGTITSDELKVQYADIPKGHNRFFGTMNLSISDNGYRMIAITKNGKFGGSIWMKQNS